MKPAINQITHVEGLFDIVGKTVDNVDYIPSQHGETDHIVIHFTDGTRLVVKASEWIEEAALEN